MAQSMHMCIVMLRISAGCVKLFSDTGPLFSQYMNNDAMERLLAVGQSAGISHHCASSRMQLEHRKNSRPLGKSFIRTFQRKYAKAAGAAADIPRVISIA